MSVRGADERRHPAVPASSWGEWWRFDLWLADRSLGASVRLWLHPGQGVAWYWCDIVGDGRPLVAVHEHDLALPRGPALEVRGEGLWSALECETPLEHWSIGLEAFGIALDDPADAAVRDPRGDRVPVGLDLEWVSAGTPVAAAALGTVNGSRYEQPCVVEGAVVVGIERIALDRGLGHRAHSWGPTAWDRPWSSSAGRLHDGTVIVQAGQPGAGLGGGGGDVVAVPVHEAPVLLTGGDGRTLGGLHRAVCRYAGGDGEGDLGSGWTEVFEPAGGD